MGLEQVIGEVRRDGEDRADKILADAKAEAERILAAAREKAQAYADQRSQAAARDAAQLEAQIRSHADFEARKTVLTTEAELRQELRQTILDGFADLKPAARKKHIESLLQSAQATIPSGTVYGASGDESTLKGQDTYKYGGATEIIGGIIVESEDGKNRLDLSYETLVADLWRDILKQEAGLFS